MVFIVPLRSIAGAHQLIYVLKHIGVWSKFPTASWTTHFFWFSTIELCLGHGFQVEYLAVMVIQIKCWLIHDDSVKWPWGAKSSIWLAKTWPKYHNHSSSATVMSLAPTTCPSPTPNNSLLDECSPTVTILNKRTADNSVFHLSPFVLLVKNIISPIMTCLQKNGSESYCGNKDGGTMSQSVDQVSLTDLSITLVEHTDMCLHIYRIFQPFQLWPALLRPTYYLRLPAQTGKCGSLTETSSIKLCTTIHLRFNITV